MNRKDYSQWHHLKSNLQKGKARPHFHEREIWFCSLGVNVGFEQDGRGDSFLRPVIILKKFNNLICLAIPLTKNCKEGVHYFNFNFTDDLISTAILSQVRLIDAKRLRYKIGSISVDDFNSLKQKLSQLLN